MTRAFNDSQVERSSPIPLQNEIHTHLTLYCGLLAIFYAIHILCLRDTQGLTASTRLKAFLTRFIIKLLHISIIVAAALVLIPAFLAYKIAGMLFLLLGFIIVLVDSWRDTNMYQKIKPVTDGLDRITTEVFAKIIEHLGKLIGDLNSVLERMEYELSQPQRLEGLEESALNAIPTERYKMLAIAQSNYKHEECVICRDSFIDEDCIRVLPACRHYFHVECVDKWLLLRGNCPLCRDAVASISDDPNGRHMFGPNLR